MRQKLFIFLFLILLAGVLIGLNAASYVQKPKTPDSELMPNRSTFNSGATGTQALFALLSETGRKVTRWQDTTADLAKATKARPTVFVVIGPVRREFTDAESDKLLEWVAGGGRLVIIDRQPPEELIKTTANWKIKIDYTENYEILAADPSDQKLMIGDTAALKPVEPTQFTRGVNAVQPSRFAASIGFELISDNEPASNPKSGAEIGAPPPPKRVATPKPAQPAETDEDERDILSRFALSRKKEVRNNQSAPRSNKIYVMPSPTPVKDFALTTFDKIDSPGQIAPVAHLATGERNLLVDVPYGNGQIVFLSDPYIVSNGGIGLVDNAQLAINILTAGNGIVAFDEYHQGYGANNNRFLQFFEGTPVVGIFIQCVIIAGFVFFSQSRRFARALPEHEPDRLTKLEYVAAMSEMQQRTRAFDLAVENIYNDFRRRAARFLGVDNYKSTRTDIAKLIADRTRLDRNDIENTMFKCEDIIHGEPTNKTEVLKLARELHILEEGLGMTRSGKGKN